jgi:hypothetical protein
MYHELAGSHQKKDFRGREGALHKRCVHPFTLLKENDLEYVGYRKYREYYNKAVRERMKIHIA